jgi:hypothetical protein
LKGADLYFAEKMEKGGAREGKRRVFNGLAEEGPRKMEKVEK